MTHVSGWCQRWRDRKTAWQLAHPDERFNAAEYDVREIRDDTTAERYVLANHYRGSYPAALRRYGLYRGWLPGERLVGVAVYSNPTNDLVLTNAFPELAPATESVELGRFVLDDDVPGNAESWFLARCHEHLAARGVAGIVSHSDPVPRRRGDGTLVMPGHVGIIYQAANAVWTGTTDPSTLWVLPDCTVLNRATLQKIRAQRRRRRYAEQLLVKHGATPLQPGEDPKAWLRTAKAAAGVRTFRHPGVHRYLFVLSENKRVRRDVRIGVPVRAGYPRTAHPRELVSR